MAEESRPGTTGAVAPPREPQQATGAASGAGGASRTWLGVVVTLAVLGAVTWLVVDGLGSAQYYLTVPEVAAKPLDLKGQRFRVSAKVKKGSLRSDSADGLQHTFVLVDQGSELVVHYDGALPDAFTDEVEVVAEGTLDAQGALRASKILARCPSKYEAERTPESVGASHPSSVPREESQGAGHPTAVPR